MAIRRVQTTFTKFPSKIISCLGDSLTGNFGTVVKYEQFYPKVLQDSLRALGCIVTCQNWGISGNTTAQMIARESVQIQRGVPTIAIVFGGANDAADGSTTRTNLITLINYLNAQGVSKVIVQGMQYRNLSGAGADTTSAEETAFAAIRVQQKAAVAATTAVYSDSYAFCRARILAGTDVQGSNTYHVSSTDYHLSAYGHSVMAACILATIQAQTGWIGALQ